MTLLSGSKCSTSGLDDGTRGLARRHRSCAVDIFSVPCRIRRHARPLEDQVGQAAKPQITPR